MLSWQDAGIVLSVRPHGENGGIASVLTETQGRVQGYVYGATSAKMRGVLETGTVVSVHWQAKNQDNLGRFTLEMEESHVGAVLGNAARLTALQAACALADKTLAEGEACTGVYAGLRALLDSFDTDIWPAAYVVWEVGLLGALGFGLDLERCVATGTTEDLVYVSPRSGCAVSRAAGAVYKEKMLRLPAFLRGGGGFDDADILDGLRMTGHFFLHRVFAPAHTGLPEPRLRLEGRFETAAAAEAGC